MMSNNVDRLRRMRNFLLRGATATIIMGLSTPANAYLDPGTGSIILQIVLGGVAGLVMVGKLFWSQIKDFFSRLFSFARTSDVESEAEKQIERIDEKQEEADRS